MLTDNYNSYSNKTRMKINLKNNHNLPQLTMIQKTFGAYKPVKEASRFTKAMIANTGEDPIKTYCHFVSKDLIQPLKRNPLHLESQYIPANPLKWSIGCTKKCNSPLFLPKHQQYTNYSYLTRTNPNTEPENKQPITAIQSQCDGSTVNGSSFLGLKSLYGSHSQSKLGWSVRDDIHSVSNKSSVPFNIINWEKTPKIILKKSSSTMFNKTLFNKKKGVAEFSDYTRLYNPNFNKEYQSLITEKPKIFHQYNGIFSNIYDAAHKNGNIYIPFKRNVSSNANGYKSQSNSSNIDN